MPITYRTFARLKGDLGTVEHLVFEQFRKWLIDDPKRAPRNYPADLIATNAITMMTDLDEVLYIDKMERDGSRTIRGRLLEHKPSKFFPEEKVRWISTYSLYLPRDKKNGFFLFEVDSPFEKRLDGSDGITPASVPNLMRRIISIDSFDLLDGSITRLKDSPQYLEAENLDELIDMACDPLRRGGLILAGTDDSAPRNHYFEKMRSVSSLVTGIASTYVLSPELTTQFNLNVGTPHSVFPGSIRTYMPEMDPASKSDAWRHPFITKTRLNELSEKTISGILETSSRKSALEVPLAREVTRVLDRLNQDQISIYTQHTSVSKTLTSKTIHNNPNLLIEESYGETLASDLFAVEIKELEKFKQRLNDIPNFGEFSAEKLDMIVDKLQMHDDLVRRLTSSEAEKIQLGNQIINMQEQYSELEEESVQDFDLKEKYAGRLDYLNNQIQHLVGEKDLNDVGRLKKAIADAVFGDQSWIDEFASQKNKIPQDLEELYLLTADVLPFVEITCSEKSIEEVNIFIRQSELNKLWAGLKSLNDFLRAKSDGIPVTNFKTYLDDKPQAYYADFPQDKLSMREAEGTENNSTLMAQRNFRVPTEVEKSGFKTMVSHLKIGYNLRAYFFIHMSGNPKAYIGYIGTHLDVPSTN